MEWIGVKDRSPKNGEIVVAWLSEIKEPACVRYTIDDQGPLWEELVKIDIYTDREDIITHWMQLPEQPKDENNY